MTAPAQSPYRVARKAFIAACEAAGMDVIARVHPSVRAPDGKPLFLDSAAMGPRDAMRGVMLIAGDDKGSALLIRLVQGGIGLPQGARLLLVHALAAQDDPAWLAAMLGAVAGEDLARAGDLKVLVLGKAPTGVAAALQRAAARVTVGDLPASNFAKIRAEIDALLAPP
jgi:Protein of unknown function (DUF2817)